MHHIVYQSLAVGEMGEADLKEILLHSRRRNQQRAITGLLLYSAGSIMQVLEGPEPVVEALYHRIEQDCRHTAIVKLADGPINRREFADWSMGFVATSPDEFARLAGYHNLQPGTFLAARPQHMGKPLFELLRDFAATKELSLL